jgi:hypothetical protein
VGQPEIEDDVATFDIAELAKPRSERVEDRRRVALRGRQDADVRDLRRGLPS